MIVKYKSTYVLQAEKISKKTAPVKGTSFSRIKSIRIKTFDGWPPLLKALINAEQAIVSGSTPFSSISKKSSQAFSHFSGSHKKHSKRIKINGKESFTHVCVYIPEAL